MQMNQREIAELHGVSPRTVRTWEAESRFPRLTSGLYDPAATIVWRAARERAVGVEEGRRLRLEAETVDVEKRKQLALARKYEATVDVMLGRLVDMDEALDVFEGVLSRVRARMTSITGRLIPLLTRYEPSEALEIIEPVVREAMEAASMAAAEDEEQEAA